VPIDRQSGEPGALGQPGVILEAFRPGTEPSRETPEEESGLSFARNSVSDDPLALLLAEEGEDEQEDDEDEGLGGLY
jgi:penicillin-binding protein 1A